IGKLPVEQSQIMRRRVALGGLESVPINPIARAVSITIRPPRISPPETLVEEAKSPIPESVMIVPIEFCLAESSPIEHPVSIGEARVLAQGAPAHFTASEGTLAVRRSARAGVDHMVTRHEHAATWPMHRHSAARPMH